jgi:protein gp37
VSDTSNIEWTDASWNCLAGCQAISPGCAHCYAATMTRRLEAMGQQDYTGLVDLRKKHFNGIVRCLPDKLTIPLKWRKPKRIFVNSMSDLFHEDVPDQFIDKAFSVMALAPKHTYQVLTKRAERMARYMNDPETPNRISKWAFGFALENHGYDNLHFFNWPMRQIWLGVSCEDQQRAGERIPWLQRTPAAVRFVSAEPLLGPIDIVGSCGTVGDRRGGMLDWVIVGGESGHGSRPCDQRWILSIVQQCEAAQFACFVKQLGRHSFDGQCRGKPFDGSCGHAKAIDGKDQRHWLILDDKKGGDPAEWPEDLRVRQMPEVARA